MRIVLTGTSSGIGRDLAAHLLASGHEVWGLARSPQTSPDPSRAASFQSSRCDVSEWSQMQAVATAVEASWPHIDALIACAGIQGEIGRALTANPERWSETVRANLDGTYFTLRAFAALLQKAPRRAKVVCFSGGGATKPRSHFSAYGVAKTGIVRLVETIAAEESSRPFDINAIAPGAINTRLTEEVLKLGPTVAGEAEYNAALKQKASGGAGMEKTLGLVDWLLSPASDGISGRLLSALWDPWSKLEQHTGELAPSEIYTLRRIVPEDRGLRFGP